MNAVGSIPFFCVETNSEILAYWTTKFRDLILKDDTLRILRIECAQVN